MYKCCVHCAGRWVVGWCIAQLGIFGIFGILFKRVRMVQYVAKHFSTGTENGIANTDSFVDGR